MLLKIYPENPNPKAVQRVVECLQDGGIVIYPTDTIYGMGCDIFKPKSVERITQILGDTKKKSAMTFICHDLSNLSDYTKPINNNVFKAMKKALPVPDNNIVREIVAQLGHPILSTSVKDDDEVIEYTTDPELIYERFGDMVDIVIDGGYGDNVPSTVVNCVDGDIEVVREGKGDIDLLY